MTHSHTVLSITSDTQLCSSSHCPTFTGDDFVSTSFIVSYMWCADTMLLLFYYCCCYPDTELGCNRTLLVPDYEQHAGTPFCKACFMKNFMKGGARGVALEGEFQTMGLSDNHNNSGLSPTAGGGSSSTHVPYRSATTSSSSSATGGGAAASSSSGAKPAGGKFAFLGGGAKCPACTKTVYKVQELATVLTLFQTLISTALSIPDLTHRPTHYCHHILDIAIIQ